jgi:putative nucleotidyltransferase with HDIG domain
MYRVLSRLKRYIKRFLKVKAETRQTSASRLRSKISKVTMLIMAAVLISLFYPAENLFLPLDFPRRGEIAFEDIIAPFQITVEKSQEELREEKESATEAIPIILVYDGRVVDSIIHQYNRFILSADSSFKANRSKLKNASKSPLLYEAILDSMGAALSANFPSMDRDAILKVLKFGKINRTGEIISDILKNEIYFIGVMPNLGILPGPKTRSIIVRIDKREIFVVRDKLLDLSRAYVNFLTALNNRSLADSIDVDIFYDFGRHFIAPNLSVDTFDIRARRDAAIAEISHVREVVLPGEGIARAGSRINESQERILEAMYRQMGELAKGENLLAPFLPVLARMILVLIAFLMLYLYLFHFRNQVYHSNPKLLALFLIYALELFLIYIIGIKSSLSIYLYPLAIFSILVTVLFDAEIGIFNTFILALLLGILHRFNFTIVIMMMIIGTVACYSTRHVRHRTEFFRSIIYLSITYVALIYLIESFKVLPNVDVINLIGYGLVNGVLSPLLAIGILPFFESIFGFTTDITLLELSDLNRPLLKRLSLEAPGTYHHSIVVGNLAESAAKAIDANSLLARVGAYYHDIGKMEIPEYFVENQLGIRSKHDSLTPSMSAIILSSHVKKGRLLGEEADLPDELLNFIEEHHGTMSMTYFYNKAKEMGLENSSMDDYRYPGPKPRTRETAIVMLADTAEAASRTLSEPKPARIKSLVQSIINDRFQSGELVECPLTLKDLSDIGDSFVQILVGVFHQRIEYPTKEEDKS